MAGNEVAFQRVVDQPAAADELAGDFLVTIAELYLVTWSEGVGCPSLAAPTGAPDPTAQQNSVVGVAGTIAPQAVVDEAGRELIGQRLVNAFGANL